MDNKKINEYKTKLEEEKTKLQEEIEKLSIPLDMGDEPGYEDEMDEAEEFYNQQAKADVLRNRLADVELALYRIQKGTFGKCEKCGAEIEEHILDADATNELCEKCIASK